MDITLNVDNTMDTLEFHWVAFFKDGSFLTQFNLANKTETLFKEVQNNFDSLSSFTLRHRFKDIQFSVDLENGTIFSGVHKVVPTEPSKFKNKIELVYFRRHTIGLSAKMIEVDHTLNYFLGYRYDDDYGNPHKVVIQIDREGNWSLCEQSSHIY